MKKVWIISWNKYLEKKDERISCVFSVHKTKYDAIMEMKKWKRKEDKFDFEEWRTCLGNGEERIEKIPACIVHFDENTTGYFVDETGPEWLTLECAKVLGA